MQSRLVALAALAASLAVSASEPRAPRPHPADPAARVAPLGHESAFARAKPHEVSSPASWKSVNDEVAALGGHAGHLKATSPGAQEPAKRPAAPAKAPDPAPAPARGHPPAHKH